jgi:hypothetical protein
MGSGGFFPGSRLAEADYSPASGAQINIVMSPAVAVHTRINERPHLGNGLVTAYNSNRGIVGNGVFCPVRAKRL